MKRILTPQWAALKQKSLCEFLMSISDQKGKRTVQVGALPRCDSKSTRGFIDVTLTP